jgi:hypothetical protein
VGTVFVCFRELVISQKAKRMQNWRRLELSYKEVSVKRGIHIHPYIVASKAKEKEIQIKRYFTKVYISIRYCDDPKCKQSFL